MPSISKSQGSHVSKTSTIAEQHRFINAIFPDGSSDTNVDSSTSAVLLYGGFDASEKEVEETMNSIFDRLWIGKGVGGLARYENDDYQRVSKDVTGNPGSYPHSGWQGGISREQDRCCS